MSDIEIRRIPSGATWVVRQRGETIASGTECCESCARRAARRVLSAASAQQNPSGGAS